MEEVSKDIEMLYIQEVLDQHGEYLCDLFVDDIEDKGLIETEKLIRSVEDYKVTNEGLYKKLVHKFYGYGRALEIRYHRAKREGKWETNTNVAVWGHRQNKKRRKNTQWYSKNVYGSLNRLISIIQNELTEEETKRLKGILQKRQLNLLSNES